MKKIKILIIVVIFIILMLIGFLIFVNYNNKNEDTNQIIQNQFQYDENSNMTQNKLNVTDNDKNGNISGENTINTSNNNNNSSNKITELTSVKDRTSFFTVKSLVEKYLNSIANKNGEAVYSILDKAYTNQLNITKDNVLQNVGSYTEQQIYTANKMEYAITQGKEIYIVYGTRRDDKLNSRGEEIEFNATVILNRDNNTFSLIPGILNVKTSYEKVGITSSNEYNKYSSINVDDMTMANLYFVNYKSKILNNLQEAYGLLDEKYKEKRFKTFSDFRNYVEERTDKISRSNLNRYVVEKNDDNTIYICIDQYNNYYIFKETAIMQYKSMLDDYTIDTSSFIKEYNDADLQKRTELNIQKFIKMINNKDYESAYNILNQEFRRNNFVTLEEFKTYIYQNFYNYVDVKFEDFGTEGDILTYKVKINGIVDNKSASFEKTIIMKLGIGTSFEMSFNI